MKPFFALFAAMLALLVSQHQSFALEPIAQREIDHLITHVAKSGYRFIRSGKEYSAEEGAAHMRMKLGRAGGKVKTAEDFITGIASKSYLTGEIYSVKTPEGKTFPTGPWLTEALVKYRKVQGAK